MAKHVETASPVHLPAKDDAEAADGLKPSKSKRKGKKVLGHGQIPAILCPYLVCVQLPAVQVRKPFLPLPTLEAAQHKLPWQLAFSQRLGRHAIASQDIAAGKCVLAEAAICAVPAQACEATTCHTCFSPLPEDSDEHLNTQGVILDKSSRHYKRYCSQKCYEADSTVSMTAPVHASVLQISLQTKCDPVLLRFILELDAHTKHAPAADTPSPGKAPCSDAQTESDQISHETEQVPGDCLDVITCTLADVDALLSPWDRNQKDWREALTEGMSLHLVSMPIVCQATLATSILSTSQAIATDCVQTMLEWTAQLSIS